MGNVGVPPATIFGSQIFLGFLFGLWGIALALPLIAVVKVILRHAREGSEAALPVR